MAYVLNCTVSTNNLEAYRKEMYPKRIHCSQPLRFISDLRLSKINAEPASRRIRVSRGWATRRGSVKILINTLILYDILF